MLKVLFITRKWPPAVGGMETYSVELTKDLAKLSELSILKLPGKTDGKPPSKVRLFLFFIQALVKIVFSKRFDVIHIGDMVLWPLSIVIFIFKPGTQVFITAYGLDIIYSKRQGLLPKIYGLYLGIGKILLGKKLNVIAISRFTAALCKDHGFTQITVIPLGVRHTLPAESINPTANPDYLLFIGRLVKRKGAGWFIQNVLPHLDESIRLIVVGKIWDEEERKILQDAPRVKHIDYVSSEELQNLRLNSIAVLMPNIASNGLDVEGFGLTAVEAAAEGGVLLASAIEGITDAVMDGITGFLLPSEDVNAWIQQIHTIHDWPLETRIDFIKNAIHAVDRNYSWERVARKTLDLYQSKL